MQNTDKVLSEWFNEIYDFSSTHKKANGFITVSENLSESQSQTKESFGYQWSNCSRHTKEEVREWLFLMN